MTVDRKVKTQEVIKFFSPHGCISKTDYNQKVVNEANPTYELFSTCINLIVLVQRMFIVMVVVHMSECEVDTFMTLP